MTHSQLQVFDIEREAYQFTNKFMVTAGYLLFPTWKQKEGAGDCIAEGNRGWKEEIGKYHFSKIYITKIMPISMISIMA